LRAAHADVEQDACELATGDVERGLAQLQQRMARSGSHDRRMARWRRGWHELARGWRRALVAQAVAILVLGLTLAWLPGQEQAYQTLGNASPNTAAAGNSRLVVRFRPEATEQEMRRVLRDSDTRLVYGPTTTDAYVLSVPAGREKAAVVRLRKESAVLLVESLDGEAMP
jgi:hypothetical protein